MHSQGRPLTAPTPIEPQRRHNAPLSHPAKVQQSTGALSKAAGAPKTAVVKGPHAIPRRVRSCSQSTPAPTPATAALIPRHAPDTNFKGP
eukprot:3441908-Pyramimonas_sp.AAC.1